MQNTWPVILPPIIVLILAFTTKRVIFSLFCGVLSAALILNNFAPYATIQTVITKTWATTELGNLFFLQDLKNSLNLFICLFLLILGIIISLVTHSGGAYAFSNYIKNKFKTPKSIQTSSVILSLLFFIDDAFSILTVGSVMYPLTDRFKIARAKIGFLVNSMAAPLCTIVPISVWAAYIVMQFRNSGISNIAQQGTYILADPLAVYLKTIPFVFYAIIMLLSVWFIVRRNISFGLMYKHEKIAQETGNLFGGKKSCQKTSQELSEKKKAKANMIDFLLPIITLLFTVIISMLYLGDFYLLGGTNNIIQAFNNTKASTALLIGGIFTLLITVLYFALKKQLHLKDLYYSCKESLDSMGSCIIVLILAWTFSGLLKDDLATGQYIAQVFFGHLNIIILPFLFFVITAAISAGMGSAWGSMAVIIPIAIPMLTSLLLLHPPVYLPDIQFLFPTLGAILSGAVSGNQTSPISDSSVLTAASTGCYHMDHVRTEHTYSIPVIFFTGLSFLISGFLTFYNFSTISNVLISLSVGLFGNFIYLKIRTK